VALLCVCRGKCCSSEYKPNCLQPSFLRKEFAVSKPDTNTQPESAPVVALTAAEKLVVAYNRLVSFFFSKGAKPTVKGSVGDLVQRVDERETSRGKTSYCELRLTGPVLERILTASEEGREVLNAGLQVELLVATHKGGYEDSTAAGSQELAKLLNGL
jgi:hypothetical protein